MPSRHVEHSARRAERTDGRRGGSRTLPPLYVYLVPPGMHGRGGRGSGRAAFDRSSLVCMVCACDPLGVRADRASSLAQSEFRLVTETVAPGVCVREPRGPPSARVSCACRSRCGAYGRGRAAVHLASRSPERRTERRVPREARGARGPRRPRRSDIIAETGRVCARRAATGVRCGGRSRTALRSAPPSGDSAARSSRRPPALGWCLT